MRLNREFGTTRQATVSRRAPGISLPRAMLFSLLIFHDAGSWPVAAQRFVPDPKRLWPVCSLVHTEQLLQVHPRQRETMEDGIFTRRFVLRARTVRPVRPALPFKFSS